MFTNVLKVLQQHGTSQYDTMENSLSENTISLVGLSSAIAAPVHENEAPHISNGTSRVDGLFCLVDCELLAVCFLLKCSFMGTPNSLFDGSLHKMQIHLTILNCRKPCSASVSIFAYLFFCLI